LVLCVVQQLANVYLKSPASWPQRLGLRAVEKIVHDVQIKRMHVGEGDCSTRLLANTRTLRAL
jgi:hypothetical protein